MYLFIWTILGSWSHGPILRRTGDVEAAEFRGKVCKGCNSTELLRFFVDEVVNWFCSGNSHSNFKYLVVFPYFPKQWTITGKHGKNMKTTVTFILFILLWCIIWEKVQRQRPDETLRITSKASQVLAQQMSKDETSCLLGGRVGGMWEVSGNSGRKLWL